METKYMLVSRLPSKFSVLAKGKLICEYGHDEFGMVESIAINSEYPQLVVAAE